MRDFANTDQGPAPAEAPPASSASPEPAPVAAPAPTAGDALLGPSELGDGGTFGGLRQVWKRRELTLGNPSDPNSGYFTASAKEQGARWKTADGSFKGTADRKGLDSSYRLGADDELHARAGKGDTTLAWEHDGRNEGELYFGKGEAGLRRNDALGDGVLTSGLRRENVLGEPTENAFGRYRTNDGTFTGEAALGIHDGHAAEHAKLSYAPRPGDSINGELVNDNRGLTASADGTYKLGDGETLAGSARYHHGPDGTTGSISGGYTDPHTHVDAGYTRNLDGGALHLGASEQLSPEQSVSGRFDRVTSATGTETSVGVGERYRARDLVHQLDLEGGVGTRDYVKATGSGDMKLANNVYGGAWGSLEADRGQKPSSQLGASLTLTPSEKTALTLAGVMDQSGSFDARLQLDVLKAKLASASDLSDHRKDAILSLFLQYSHGNPNMLDDRFGAGRAETELGHPGAGNQVTAGVRIKF